MNTPDLQELWDAALLRAWHDDILMNTLGKRFLAEARLLGCLPPKKTGNLWDAMNALDLLRKPDKWWGKWRVRVFVDEHLKWLSDQLWDETRSDDELLAILASSDYTVGKRDNAYHNTLQNMRRQRVANQLTHQKDATIEKRGYRNEMWSVTKGIRSKK
jgi:hypothetical protein